jgi:hypothetical protein
MGSVLSVAEEIFYSPISPLRGILGIPKTQDMSLRGAIFPGTALATTQVSFLMLAGIFAL